MRKNTKGFTLIELLAVIVILAVIALIATPIIMGVINDAKEGANKDAALGYGKAVENAIATQMIKCPDMTVAEDAISVEGNTIAVGNCTGTNSLNIVYKGTKPTTGTVKYETATGKVTGTVKFAGDNHTYSVVDGAQS